MKIKYNPLPSYGDHMTLKKFIEMVETGCFIDYDGCGYYATKTKISDKLILPSHITGREQRFSMETGKFTTVNIKKTIDKNFDYVVWYYKIGDKMCKKRLTYIFNHYKKTFNLKTTLCFKSNGEFSFFRPIDNKIFIIFPYSVVEAIDIGFNITVISIGEFKNLCQTSEEGYIFILLHEIKHAIDYTHNYIRFQKEAKKYNEINLNLQPIEKRADKFAIKEIKKWRKKKTKVNFTD